MVNDEKASKVPLENGKCLELYLKRDHWKNILDRKLQVFWVNIYKMVIGNLAYREMLFYTKTCVIMYIMYIYIYY